MAERMVIDSSVIAKWFLDDETDVDLAENILLAILAGEIEGYIPRVTFYEVCHLLTKACQSRSRTQSGTRIPQERAAECIREFLGLPLEKPDVTDQECLGAFEMAVENSKPHADMAFLWRAIQLDCQWCTADVKVLDACRATFPSAHVLHLSSTR
jgi:predicted nucleic acid-binding protein